MNLRIIFFFLTTTLATAAQTENEWTVRLQKTLEGANALRILSECQPAKLFSTNPSNLKPVGQMLAKEDIFIKNADEVQNVIRRIQIAPVEKAGICLCIGDPLLLFYKDETPFLYISIHHGTRIRWQGNDELQGGAMLTPESAEFFRKWLADLGINVSEKEPEAHNQKSK